MNVSIDSVNETRKTVAVTVPVGEVKKTETEVLKSYSRHAKIPGFRPGKAPQEMLKQKYRKELEEDLGQKVTAKAYNFVLNESKLDVYSLVDATIPPRIDTSSDASIVFFIDVKPNFELPEYKGIEVNLPAESVSDEEVEKAVNKMREERAEYRVVEKAAEKGDYVKVSYEGKIGDQSIADVFPDKPIYGKQESTWEEAGTEEDLGVRAVIDGVVGMKAGDEKEAAMVFPDDFKEQPLAGKEAVYSITVNEVRQKVLPELDEEMLKTLEADSVEQLRSNVKDKLLEQKRHESRHKGLDQIVKFLGGSISFPIPESAVNNEAESVLRTHMTRLIRQGIPEEEFEKRKEELIAEARKIGEGHAKTNFILEQIAEKESIKAEDKDLQMQIMRESMMSGQNPQEFVKELKDDRQRLNKVRLDALCYKVLDFLFKEAKVNYEDAEPS